VKKLLTIIVSGVILFALGGCYGYDDEYESGELIPEVQTYDLVLGYAITLYNNDINMVHSFCQDSVTIQVLTGDDSFDGVGSFVSGGNVVIEKYPSGYDIALTTSDGTFAVGDIIKVDYTGSTELPPVTVGTIEKIFCEE
jgi:hypothetical protein